jgi:hypothetical protein
LNNKQKTLYNGFGGVDLLSLSKTTIKNVAVTSPLTISTHGTQICASIFDQTNIKTKLAVPTSGGSSLLSSFFPIRIVASSPLKITEITDTITVTLEKVALSSDFSLQFEAKAPLTLGLGFLTGGALGTTLTIDLSACAPKASPSFTGTRTAPNINATSALQVNGTSVGSTYATIASTYSKTDVDLMDFISKVFFATGTISTSATKIPRNGNWTRAFASTGVVKVTFGTARPWAQISRS